MKKIIVFYFCLVVLWAYPQKDTTFIIDSLTPKISYVIFNEGDYTSSILVSHGSDGIVLFDNGCYKNFDWIIDCFGGQEKLNSVILTHWHFDHVLGNKKIKNKSVKIVSTARTSFYLSHKQELLGTCYKPYPKKMRPSVLINEKTNLCINGDSVILFPFQGHTDGDLVIYFPELKILHIGDLIFPDMFAFYDIFHGGDVNKSLMTLNKIRDDFPDDITIISSHGRYYSMSDLSAYIIMLEGVIKEVVSASSHGMDLEEMKKRNILSPWKEYAKSFSCDDMLDFVYQSHLKIE